MKEIALEAEKDIQQEKIENGLFLKSMGMESRNKQ